jgi:hypothetical protein
MQRILDRAVRSSRVRSCRLSFPVLALGICAFTCLAQQAALGQAQVGSAETCFDEGPDKLPAIPSTPIPSLPAEMPARTAQTLLPARTRPANATAVKPSHTLSQDSRTRNSLTTGSILKKKPPEGTLTAAR